MMQPGFPPPQPQQMMPGQMGPGPMPPQGQQAPEPMGGGALSPQLGFTEYTPNDRQETQQTAEDVVQEVRERMAQAWTHDRQNRDDAVQDLRFLAGDQWPEYAKAARKDRPMLTINKLPVFLHQVTNDIRQHAPVLKVTPVDGKTDPVLAKIYDGIISDIQYRSSAKNVYATAAYHAAACGIGHFRILTKYVDDATFDQEVQVESIPYPLAVYWDPAAVKPDRSDAMWCCVVDQVPKKTFEAKYPGKDKASVDAYSSSTVNSGLFWATSDYVLVAEYWVKVPETRMLCAFQNGEVVDCTGMQMHDLAMLQMQMGQVVGKRMVKTHRVEQYLVTGTEVLTGPNKWPGKMIPIVPVVGDEVPLERTIVRHGLIRHARDPQQLYNFYRSAAAEHIALSPKSPYLVTDAMISKHRGQWNSLNTANRPYLSYTPDTTAPGTKPERIHAPEPPEALWREGQMASDDIKATTGIYDASLGAKSNETSGVAIKRREQQGDTANFHYADNLSRSLECCGRILIDIIPKIYDSQRTQRLLNEDGSEQFVPINHQVMGQDGRPVLINDLSQARFDIRVVIGPSYATKRLEAADALMELMGHLPPEMAPILADIAVRNLDIPDAQEAAKRIKAMLPPQALRDPDQGPPPPPDPMQDPTIRAQMMKDQAQTSLMYAQAGLAREQTEKLKNTPIDDPNTKHLIAMAGQDIELHKHASDTRQASTRHGVDSGLKSAQIAASQNSARMKPAPGGEDDDMAEQAEDENGPQHIPVEQWLAPPQAPPQGSPPMQQGPQGGQPPMPQGGAMPPQEQAPDNDMAMMPMSPMGLPPQ